MAYSNNNLGDYKKVVEDLNAAGGSLKNLYDQIGNDAVAKATPGIKTEGIVIGTVIMAFLWGTKEVVCRIPSDFKRRKKAIEKEANLQKEFYETMQKIECDTFDSEGCAVH